MPHWVGLPDEPVGGKHRTGRRLTRIFLRNDNGETPVYGSMPKFQQDPYWRDLVLFFEYFDGDTGAGLGASHQTGWTGLVAKLIQQSGERSGELAQRGFAAN